MQKHVVVEQLEQSCVHRCQVANGNMIKIHICGAPSCHTPAYSIDAPSPVVFSMWMAET